MVLKYETVYSTLPVQSYIIATVKKPILESIPVIFDPEASKTAKLKAAARLWRALQSMSRLPAPTKENTWHPNSHKLIELRDWLLSRLPTLHGQRRGLIEKLFNFVIIIYDYDPPWRWIMDSVKDKALDMNLKPRGYSDDWCDGYEWWCDEVKD